MDAILCLLSTVSELSGQVPFLASTRSLLAVAPPVHGLNVVRVIVAPCSAHTARVDVVGNDIAVVGELLLANTTNAVLSRNLAIQQLPHLPVGAQLAVSTRMLGIVDAPGTNQALTPFFWNPLPATAGKGAVDWTKLIATESHGILLVGRKANDGFLGD